MTYDNTDERGEDAVSRQRGGSEPGQAGMSEPWWAQYVAPAAFTVGISLGILGATAGTLIVTALNGWAW